MRRVTIVTSTHVSNNPRVWREAEALSRAGFTVSVAAVLIEEEPAAEDERLSRSGGWTLVPAADVRSFRRSPARWFASRVRRRIALRLERHGLGSIDAIAYVPHALLRTARSIPTDLYIVHLEGGLWVGRRLARQGYRVSADIEDWHSENALDMRPATRDYLRRLEGDILRRAIHCTTTSDAMAAALADAYGAATPHPIYNGDPEHLLPLCDPPPNGPLKLLWFSQTLGPDRGLQDAFLALAELGSRYEWQLDLVARSSAENRNLLLQLLQPDLRKRIRFMDRVLPGDLPGLVSRYDLGLALERRTPANKDLTVANKILRYGQSGLSIAATATRGHREVLSLAPSLGAVYEPGRVSQLAQLLYPAISAPEQVRAGRVERAREANRLFGYEQQAQRLVALVEQALAPERAG